MAAPRSILTTSLLALALAAGAFAAWAVAQGVRPATDRLIPYTDEAAVAAGAEIYAEHCAACHGADLEGQVPEWRKRGPDGLMPAPPHDESGHTWHHPDPILIDITTR